MRLVPRQLQRAGMTGNVPYYGGRFSPAQAYAAAHPSIRPRPADATAPGPRGHRTPAGPAASARDRRRPMGGNAGTGVA